MEGNRLSEDPAMNNALDSLTKIERMVRQGEFEQAKAEFQTTAELLNQIFETGKEEDMRTAVENRLTALSRTLYGAPDPMNGDEV